MENKQEVGKTLNTKKTKKFEKTGEYYRPQQREQVTYQKKRQLI